MFVSAGFLTIAVALGFVYWTLRVKPGDKPVVQAGSVEASRVLCAAEQDDLKMWDARFKRLQTETISADDPRIFDLLDKCPAIRAERRNIG